MSARPDRITDDAPVSMEDFLRELYADTGALRELIRHRLFAIQEAQDPSTADAIEDAEERIRTGEGFPDAVPAEEFVERVKRKFAARP